MKLLNPIPDRDTMLQFQRLAYTDYFDAKATSEIIFFFNSYVNKREVCPTCPDKVAIARREILAKWELYGEELKNMFPSVEQAVQTAIKTEPDPWTTEWLQAKLDQYGMHKQARQDVQDYKNASDGTPEEDQ